MFVDTSVLIAAALSSTGGSFYILTTLSDRFQFQINEYVLQESIEVLEEKFSEQEDLKNTLFLLLGLAGIKVLPFPSFQAVKALDKIVNVKDAPILASALAQSAWLITLDQDFLQSAVLEFAAARGLTIVKPKEFILQRGA